MRIPQCDQGTSVCSWDKGMGWSHLRLARNQYEKSKKDRGGDVSVLLDFGQWTCKPADLKIGTTGTPCHVQQSSIALDAFQVK